VSCGVVWWCVVLYNVNRSLIYVWLVSPKDRAMAQAVSRRPPTAEARVRSRSVHVVFVVDKVALGQIFPRVLWFSPVSFIPPVLHC
jgi:hypothetical protein